MFMYIYRDACSTELSESGNSYLKELNFQAKSCRPYNINQTFSTHFHHLINMQSLLINLLTGFSMAFLHISKTSDKIQQYNTIDVFFLI